jgi:hypothetical protein
MCTTIWREEFDSQGVMALAPSTQVGAEDKVSVQLTASVPGTVYPSGAMDAYAAYNYSFYSQHFGLAPGYVYPDAALLAWHGQPAPDGSVYPMPDPAAAPVFQPEPDAPAAPAAEPAGPAGPSCAAAADDSDGDQGAAGTRVTRSRRSDRAREFYMLGGDNMPVVEKARWRHIEHHTYTSDWCVGRMLMQCNSKHWVAREALHRVYLSQDGFQ